MLSELDRHLTKELVMALRMPQLFHCNQLQRGWGVVGYSTGVVLNEQVGPFEVTISDEPARRELYMTVVVFHVDCDQLRVYHHYGDQLAADHDRVMDTIPLSDSDSIEQLQVKIDNLCRQFLAMRRQLLSASR